MKGRFGLMSSVVAANLGCADVCGSYQYKGVRGTERCGDVYGSEGRFFEGEPEVAWGEIAFAHTVPAAEFNFDHYGYVSARFLWADLESGEPLDADRVLVTCHWIDRGDPLTPLDDVERTEHAEDVALQGHGRGFNLDPPGESRVRELSWRVSCGDWVYRLEARDKIKFDFGGAAEVLDLELAAWLEARGS